MSMAVLDLASMCVSNHSAAGMWRLRSFPLAEGGRYERDSHLDGLLLSEGFASMNRAGGLQFGFFVSCALRCVVTNLFFQAMQQSPVVSIFFC